MADIYPIEPDHQVELSQGTIHYRDSGQGHTILFIHGLLVDGTLWRKVTDPLSSRFRCIAPDWPLGSHRQALASTADPSPRAVAHLIADFLAHTDLQDVTIVANDTGGAIAQLLVTERPERIGRLVLTPCDAYENFLPLAFRPLQWLAHVPGALTLAAQPMRSARIRRSALGYGLLTNEPIPAQITERWIRPSLSNAGVRRDVRRLLASIDSRDTIAAAEKLREFERPVLIAWAPEDRFFKLRYAERLAAAIPNARLELVPGSRTFMPEDQPQRLAELITQFLS